MDLTLGPHLESFLLPAAPSIPGSSPFLPLPQNLEIDTLSRKSLQALLNNGFGAWLASGPYLPSPGD